MCFARPGFSNRSDGQLATGTTYATRILTGAAEATAAKNASAPANTRNTAFLIICM